MSAIRKFVDAVKKGEVQLGNGVARAVGTLGGQQKTSQKAMAAAAEQEAQTAQQEAEADVLKAQVMERLATLIGPFKQAVAKNGPDAPQLQALLDMIKSSAGKKQFARAVEALDLLEPMLAEQEIAPLGVEIDERGDTRKGVECRLVFVNNTKAVLHQIANPEGTYLVIIPRIQTTRLHRVKKATAPSVATRAAGFIPARCGTQKGMGNRSIGSAPITITRKPTRRCSPQLSRSNDSRLREREKGQNPSQNSGSPSPRTNPHPHLGNWYP